VDFQVNDNSVFQCEEMLEMLSMFLVLLAPEFGIELEGAALADSEAGDAIVAIRQKLTGQ